MGVRQAVHALVDVFPEEDLPIVQRLLEMLRNAASSVEIEDALDSYAIRALRQEQSGDDTEALGQFGRRLGLT